MCLCRLEESFLSGTSSDDPPKHADFSQVAHCWAGDWKRITVAGCASFRESSGLKILERHPHSRDIYDDRTRFTPLGADATVSFGFKDLRVLNNLPTPFCFNASVAPDRISVALCSPEHIEKHIVEFVTTSQADGFCTVETRRRNSGDLGDTRSCVLNVSTYRRLN